MTNPNHLFVYGTLQPEYNNNYAEFLKQNCSVEGYGYFYGKLYKIDDYPGAIYDCNDDSKVFGIVYNIKNTKEFVLNKIDKFEEYGPEYHKPNEFERKIIDVTTASHTLKCWVYLYNQSVKKCLMIASGDYLEFSKTIASF